MKKAGVKGKMGPMEWKRWILYKKNTLYYNQFINSVLNKISHMKKLKNEIDERHLYAKG